MVRRSAGSARGGVDSQKIRYGTGGEGSTNRA